MLDTIERRRRLSRGERVAFVAAPLAAVTLIVVVAWWADANDTPLGRFVRDPNQYARSGAWTGLISTLGNSLWVVSATATLLAAAVARRTDRAALLALGWLSVFLHIDDTYLFHDVILPDRGVPEKLVSAAWVTAGLGAFLVSRTLLRRHGLLVPVVVAGVGFAVSILADALDVRRWGENWLFGVEDGAKFVAIVVWTCVSVVLARRTLGATTDR